MIAENTEPSWTESERWQVDSPLVHIGVVEGDPLYQLHRVIGAVRLTDGRIVVANGGTNELRFYDHMGRYLSTAGRTGEGPGEFRQLARLDAMRGDTLVVFDGALRRISLFDAAGTFVRTFGLPAIDERTYPRPRGGVFADGSVLAYTERSAGPGTVVREPGLFYRIGAGDTVPRIIGEFPIRGFFVDSLAGSMVLPFEPHSWPVAAGEVFYVGHGGGFDIGVYSRDGVLVRQIRWLRTPEQVTADDVTRFMDGQLARIEDVDLRERLRPRYEEVYSRLETPLSKPAFSDIRIDRESNIWAAEYRSPGGSLDAWFVFNPEGRLLGRVDFPEGVIVYHIGTDAVVARSTHDLGVEHIIMYRLRKPGSSDDTRNTRP